MCKEKNVVIPVRLKRCDAMLTSFLNVFSYKILLFLVKHLRFVLGEKHRFYRQDAAMQQR